VAIWLAAQTLKTPVKHSLRRLKAGVPEVDLATVIGPPFIAPAFRLSLNHLHPRRRTAAGVWERGRGAGDVRAGSETVLGAR